MLDYVIKQGKIVDGTGNPWFRGDLGIVDNQIVEIGAVHTEAKQQIDAQHLVVSPGFIDGHSHSDLLLMNQPTSDIKLQQGVTTEVVGNCGLAPAPLTRANEQLLRSYIEPVVGGRKGVWNWHSVGEYIQEMVKAQISENVATYVAHGSLRIAAMGFENRPASVHERQQMKEMLVEGLKAGAIGLSIGLLYSPGRYASKEEIADLCSVLPAFDGLLATHIRGEGNNLLSSINEVIWIAERVGVRLQISHLKAAGKRNWGLVVQALELIEEARARGVDVACDVYPYRAGSTMLSTLLPPWTLEGGMQNCLVRLSDPATREVIKAELSEEQEDWDNLVVSTGWDSVVVSAVSPKNQLLEGKSIREISQAVGKHPIDVALDLLIEEDGNVSIVYYHMSDDDVETVIQSHLSLIISDSLGCETGKPHPRTYGTFPKFFADYVRRKKLLTLEQAVRKVTSYPASRFNLGKRGLIKIGFQADLTLFHPNLIESRSSFEDPINAPDGIEHVFVGGKPTIERKKNLLASGGEFLTCKCSKII
ncbi:N-acyl-D-amino-acid deacylase [Alkalihalobacillus xiaoxiensis]|uniref:N-acyl-D-amino-acid deacylase n=1 Tax=Shouchella xiaoxiensis TaxID=766895 RepID=A0ABS2SU35_9BACI|nr:D-aminoacylase [Shouchella xiaoxiensis]MBM7839023.1 N-acyl-D-amino-acid deacylase [Shouchella xiaoxiensis]